MRGLPLKVHPIRVAIQGDAALVQSLSDHAEQLILSPVETNLEISARVSQADVMVVDVTQAHDALDTIRRLQYRRPLLALVAPGGVRAALDAGARGAIEVGSSPQAITAAIHALQAGLSVVPPAFLVRAPEVQLDRLARPGPTQDVVLTPREHQVLVRLAEGLSNKEIAAELGVSGHTAKFHVNSILQKLGAQKRVEAVVRAAQRGLIEIRH